MRSGSEKGKLGIESEISDIETEGDAAHPAAAIQLPFPISFPCQRHRKTEQSALARQSQPRFALETRHRGRFSSR